MIFHNYIYSHVQKASKTVVYWFLPFTNLTFGNYKKSGNSAISSIFKSTSVVESEQFFDTKHRQGFREKSHILYFLAYFYKYSQFPRFIICRKKCFTPRHHKPTMMLLVYIQNICLGIWNIFSFQLIWILSDLVKMTCRKFPSEKSNLMPHQLFTIPVSSTSIPT